MSSPIEKHVEPMTAKHDKQVKNKSSLKNLQFELNNLKKRVHSPKVDLYEFDDSFLIVMEFPGILEKDIVIKVIDSQILLVSGFKRETTLPSTKLSFDRGKEEKKVIYTECKYGSIMRRVKVKSLVENDFAFKYNNGVLRVTLCKKPIQFKCGPDVEEPTEEPSAKVQLDKVVEMTKSLTQEPKVSKVSYSAEAKQMNWSDFE
jgi:HSP20 family molecular chaperone IbpA